MKTEMISKILKMSAQCVMLVALTLTISNVTYAQSHLVVTAKDAFKMRQVIGESGNFRPTFLAKKESVDAQISLPVTVPVPKGSGGGYTHERHKKNYKLMYDAGIIFQLTQAPRYSDYVT